MRRCEQHELVMLFQVRQTGLRKWTNIDANRVIVVRLPLVHLDQNLKRLCMNIIYGVNERLIQIEDT